MLFNEVYKFLDASMKLKQENDDLKQTLDQLDEEISALRHMLDRKEEEQ